MTMFEQLNSFLTRDTILGFFGGLIVAVLKDIFVNNKRIREYFGTPSNGKIELNWGLQQFFLLFSLPMAKRWYEAREHCYCSFFMSLLCAFKLVTIVRFDCTFDSDYCRGRYFNEAYAFWVLEEDPLDRLKQLIKDSKHYTETTDTQEDKLNLNQIFICGENVIWDAYNGGFGKYQKPEAFYQVM